MNKFIKSLGLIGLITNFLFVTHLSTFSPKIISENSRIKYAIGAATVTGVTFALAYLIYCCSTQEEKDCLTESGDFSIKLEEQEEIKKESEEDGIVSSFFKFSGITTIPAAATGGLVYWFLKGCTPAGYMKEIKAQNKIVRSKLLEKFNNSKQQNLLDGDFSRKEIVDDFIKLNFGEVSGEPLPEAYFYLKKLQKLSNESRMICEELSQKKEKYELNTTERENLEKLREENVLLSTNIAEALGAINGMRGKGFQAQFKRYREFEEKKRSRKEEKDDKKNKFMKNVLDWWLAYKAVGVAGDIAAGLV